MSYEQNKEYEGLSPYIFITFALAVACVTFLSYTPAIKAGFIWDDDAYVTGNALLSSLDGLTRIWTTNESPQYYPLVFTTFWLENHIWGLDPAGYHVVNIALHSANAALAWLIARRLNIKWAFFIGLAFALHPVNVESVAWITERKNVLSGLFYLSAMYAHLRYEDDEQGKWRWYALCILFFVMALLSKTVACTLPAALIVIRWYRGRPMNLKFLAGLTPLFVIGAAMGLNTARLEITRVGAMGPEWKMEPLERFVLSGRIAFFYFLKLIYPAKLTFIYPRWEIDATAWIEWIYSSGTVAIGFVFLFLRKKIGRGPVAAWAFFLITLFPALGFFDVYPFRYSFVADHFQYLASLGVIALLAGFAGSIHAALTKRAGLFAYLRYPAIIALAITLGALTWQQSKVYKDIEVLWKDTVKKNPAAWMAHNNLGIEFAAQERYEEAVLSYEKALALRPNHVKAHGNLANSLSKLGRHEEAMAHFQEAVRLKPFNPENFYNIGLALAEQNRFEEAVRYYQKAIQLNPSYAYARYNMAIALTVLGMIDEAIAEYKSVIALKPEYAGAHLNLATLLLNTGNIDEAKEHLSETIRLKPRDTLAYNNLGIIYSYEKNYDRSIIYYKKALALEPKNAEVWYNYAVTLSDMGKTGEAARNFLKTIEYDPDYAGAYFELGEIYLKKTEYAKALRYYEKALRLDPKNTLYRKNASTARSLKASQNDPFAR